jgi:misacylated tRNA(Ala) deacylase
MAVYLCHEQPDLLEFETEVIDRRPGAVLLGRSALHPGGGGQVSDRAALEYAGGVVQIVGVERLGERDWHLLDAAVEVEGRVRVRIDAAFRSRVAQLHTDSHILNATPTRTSGSWRRSSCPG